MIKHCTLVLMLMCIFLCTPLYAESAEPNRDLTPEPGDSIRYVDLSIVDVEIMGQEPSKPTAYPWDDMADTEMFWVGRSRALLNYYKQVDEWTIDCRVSYRYFYPSSRSECGYPVYGYRDPGKTNEGLLLDNRGNIIKELHAHNDFINRSCSGRLFALENKERDPQSTNWDIFDSHTGTLFAQVSDPGTEYHHYIRPSLSGYTVIGDSGYHGDDTFWRYINVLDPSEKVRIGGREDHEWYIVSLYPSPDLQFHVATFCHNDNDFAYSTHEDEAVRIGSGVLFLDSQMNLISYFADLRGQASASISPDSRRVVFRVGENTYLSNSSGSVIKEFTGRTSDREVVWSPSGDSFWWSGYIIEAQNGKVIGKIRGEFEPSLSDMDVHRIAFAEDFQLQIFDYSTNEKMLCDNFYGEPFLSGDGKKCTAYSSKGPRPSTTQVRVYVEKEGEE